MQAELLKEICIHEYEQWKVAVIYRAEKTFIAKLTAQFSKPK